MTPLFFLELEENEENEEEKEDTVEEPWVITLTLT